MKTRYCWYWHSGHSHLVSSLTRQDYLDRVEFVKTNKPKEEVPLRLKLLKRVKSKTIVRLMAKYDKVTAAALTEYEKVTAAASAEYAKVRAAAAWAGYAKVRADASAGCAWVGAVVLAEEE